MTSQEKLAQTRERAKNRLGWRWCFTGAVAVHQSLYLRVCALAPTAEDSAPISAPKSAYPHTFQYMRNKLSTTVCGLALCLLFASCDRPQADTADRVPDSTVNPLAALLNPDPAALAATAPDSFTLALQTSKGEIEVRVRRDWSPLGADRLHYLATHGFFDGARFFRIVPGFIVQFGLSGRPDVDRAFKRRMIADDPVTQSNRRGTLVFATSGPNTRTTQLFINLADNPSLDRRGFSPMGEVVRGMDVVDRINAEYGEQSNIQGRIEREGNAFFRARFPALDSIVHVTITP